MDFPSLCLGNFTPQDFMGLSLRQYVVPITVVGLSSDNALSEKFLTVNLNKLRRKKWN